jgi:hypothetical protein
MSCFEVIIPLNLGEKYKINICGNVAYFDSFGLKF